jgi:hypothetical protein
MARIPAAARTKSSKVKKPSLAKMAPWALAPAWVGGKADGSDPVHLIGVDTEVDTEAE